MQVTIYPRRGAARLAMRSEGGVAVATVSRRAGGGTPDPHAMNESWPDLARNAVRNALHRGSRQLEYIKPWFDHRYASTRG